MATWTEYEDAYVVEIHRSNPHPKSVFEAELGDDITVSFGEPKSKLGSGRYKLIDVAFDRATWDLDEAVDWWNDHDVRAFRAGKHGLDRKLPPVDYWLSFRDGLYVTLSTNLMQLPDNHHYLALHLH
jgi:hypothetical protein